MFRISVAIAALACTPALAQEGQRVEVNGMQLYYEVTGQGDPLIVLTAPI